MPPPGTLVCEDDNTLPYASEAPPPWDRLQLTT